MRYCVVTREISGWLGDNPPGEVVEAEFVKFEESGALVFWHGGVVIHAFAPGDWRRVVLVEEETK
jgi:hypothetical protein